jgi:hypothetical protein
MQLKKVHQLSKVFCDLNKKKERLSLDFKVHNTLLSLMEMLLFEEILMIISKTGINCISVKYNFMYYPKYH